MVLAIINIVLITYFINWIKLYIQNYIRLMV